MESKMLLKFEKENCAPCSAMQIYLDDKRIETERIDAFDTPKMASKYEIGALPTLILVIDGKEIKRTTGFNPEAIEDILDTMEG